MKTIILIFVSIALMSFSNGAIEQTRMSLNLTEIVSIPDNVQINSENNIAVISLNIDDDGLISVNEINASEVLKKAIMSKLNGYKLIDTKGVETNKPLNYRLVFEY